MFMQQSLANVAVLKQKHYDWQNVVGNIKALLEIEC
jgi:hypothetical protein